MNTKTKRILFFSALGVDVAITIFLFVVAIIMIATMPDRTSLGKTRFIKACEANGPFIGYLQMHSTVYFWACVFPLILLLVANIVFLVLYVHKINKQKQLAVDDLSEEQKAALRAELMKELQSESSELNKPEDK